MKILLSIFLLTFSSTLAFTQEVKEVKEETESVIVAGKGWDVVTLGAKRKDVESVLGEGKIRDKLKGGYFIDYPEKGIQVCYRNGKDTLAGIYFFNQARFYEDYAVTYVKTDKGISWNSSIEDVMKAYSKREVTIDKKDILIVFKDINFTFEKGKMVRIGIPGEIRDFD